MIAVLMLAASSAVPAACLLGDYSVRSEFKRSDYVAKVHVDRQTWLDLNFRPTALKRPLTFGSAPSGLDPYAGANYGVTLIELFKGKLPARFNIYSENTTGRTPLDVNGDYLVFLSRAQDSDAYIRAGALTIDNCGNSGPWRRRSRTVAHVRSLAKHAN